jgi:O-antigen/teichoic acid export membrane protein
MSVMIDTRRRRPIVGRALWSIADQVVASVGNALVVIIAARSLSAREFGAYAIAFAVYLVVLGISRALTSEPLTLRYAASPDVERYREGQAAAGCALLIGFSVAIATAVAAVMLSESIRPLMLVAALVVPLLLLQDSLRCFAITIARPKEAAINDAVWTLVAIASALALSATGARHSAAEYFGLWGASALAGVCVTSVRLHVRPRLGAGARFVQKHFRLSSNLLAQFGLQTASSQLLIFCIALTGGVSAVAGVEASQSLLGPISLLVMGSTFAMAPELVRQVDHPVSFRRTSAGMGIVLAVLSCGWAVVALAIPDSLGTQLYGKSWPFATIVLLPLAIVSITGACSQAPATSLRALGAANLALRTQAIVSPLTAGAGIVGAMVFGTRGALYGWALGGAFGTGLWWARFRRTLHGDPRRLRPSEGAQHFDLAHEGVMECNPATIVQT